VRFSAGRTGELDQWLTITAIMRSGVHAEATTSFAAT
jgi:hypothetical protein